MGAAPVFSESENSKRETVLLPDGGERCRLHAGGCTIQRLGQSTYSRMDVMEVPDDAPVLTGQLPLEQLDFVVDLQSRTLIGNPAWPKASHRARTELCA